VVAERRNITLGDAPIVPKDCTGLAILVPCAGLGSIKRWAGLGSISASSGDTGVVARCNLGAIGMHALGVEPGVETPQDMELNERAGLPRYSELHGLCGVGKHSKSGAAGAW